MFIILILPLCLMKDAHFISIYLPQNIQVFHDIQFTVTLYFTVTTSWAHTYLLACFTQSIQWTSSFHGSGITHSFLKFFIGTKLFLQCRESSLSKYQLLYSIKYTAWDEEMPRHISRWNEIGWSLTSRQSKNFVLLLFTLFTNCISGNTCTQLDKLQYVHIQRDKIPTNS